MLLFAANTAFAQLTMTEPVPLAPGPLGPTPRAIVSPVAAQSASSYLLAWRDPETLRLQRFGLSGEPLDAIPELTGLTLEPRSAASDGDSFVIVAVNPGRSGVYAIHVDHEGHAGAPIPLPDLGPGEILSNGRGYLTIVDRGVYSGGRERPPTIIRLDRDGHPVSQATPPAAWPHGARAVALSGTYSLVWLDFENAVHAARIDDSGNPVDDVVLERFVLRSYIAVTARPGELAVASSGGNGIRLSLFDADLKPKDSVIIDATPQTIPSLIVRDGAGYVLRLQSLVSPYPWRLLSFRGTTARELPMPATADYVVDLCGGLRYWIDKRHSVKQLFAVVDDGAETLVSVSDTEQRLPRLLRFGSAIAAVWDERTADGDVVLAALLDAAGRITQGPVRVGSTPQEIVALDAATDGTTLFVVWDFEAVLLDGSLSELNRWDDSNLRGVAPDPAGYLVFGLDYYGTSVQRYGRYSRQWGGALPLDAHFDEMRITAEDRGWLLVENANVDCSECYGLWQITLAHINAAFPPAVVSSIGFASNSTLAASVRTSAGVLLFFDHSTELRASDDFRLLASHAVASRRLAFPYQPGDALVAGGRVLAAIGDGLEVLTPEGEQLASFPIGAGVVESRLLASTRLMLVHDAPTATGSRRLFLRFVDETPAHGRAAGH